MSKRIVFSQGGKGGVGKTTVVSALLDWYAANEIPVHVLDLDAENKANSGLNYFRKEAQKINIDKRDGLDAFIDAVDNTEAPVIVADMGAGKGSQTFTWFDSVYEDCKTLDIKFTALGIVTTDPGSVTGVLEWGAHLNDKVDYLVVQNEQETEKAEFKYWDETKEVKQFIKTLKPAVIRFRSINPDLQTALRNHGVTLAQVATKKVTVPELTGSKWAIRANQILREASAEFDKVKDILLP